MFQWRNRDLGLFVMGDGLSPSLPSPPPYILPFPYHFSLIPFPQPRSLFTLPSPPPPQPFPLFHPSLISACEFRVLLGVQLDLG